MVFRSCTLKIDGAHPCSVVCKLDLNDLANSLSSHMRNNCGQFLVAPLIHFILSADLGTLLNNDDLIKNKK